MIVVRACLAVTLVVTLMAPAVSAGGQPKRKSSPWLRMTATAYCLRGITDAGTRVKPGTVAADPRVIPLGSTIHVRGMKGVRNGRYTVLDTGRGIKRREIDVFLPSCAAARRFGRQVVEVRILTRAIARP